MRPIKNVYDGVQSVYGLIRRELRESPSETIEITIETPEEHILISAKNVDLETYIDKHIGAWYRSGQLHIECDQPAVTIDKAEQ